MPTCEHKNLPSHRYCIVCGEALERIACQQCGHVALKNFQYCAECGHALESASSAQLTRLPSPATIQTQPIIEQETHKVDLNLLLSYVKKQSDSELTSKLDGKLSQADIKALIKKRKKNTH